MKKHFFPRADGFCDRSHCKELNLTVTPSQLDLTSFDNSAPEHTGKSSAYLSPERGIPFVKSSTKVIDLLIHRGLGLGCVASIT